MDKEYQIIVQYIREKDIYHDRYYAIGSTDDEALEKVKASWENNSYHIFPEAKDAKFFMEVE